LYNLSFRDITKQLKQEVVMQPRHKFPKTLLASGLLLGLSNAFTASAETFTITAEGIPDVQAAPVTGFTTLGFGSTIKGSKVGDSCTIQGAASFSDANMAHDLNGDGTADTLGGTTLFGSVSGDACVNDATGVASGNAMIIEIDGVTSSTVSVTVNDVTGPNANFTYTPSSESCVVLYDTGTTATGDICSPLTSGSVTGVGMSEGKTAEGDAGSTDYDSEILGKVRMILAGTITITQAIAQGVAETVPVVVTVVYE
jgi:hypothetical protein